MDHFFGSTKNQLFGLIGLLLSTCLFSCKTTRNNETRAIDSKKIERDKKTNDLLKEAFRYSKTNYKTGGTNSDGMDCSGLVFTSFKKIEIELPRASIQQSKIGTAINLKDAERGDLIFFATNEKNKVINHVGIITKVGEEGNVFFIHSTIQRGVIESSLLETYYKRSFVKVNRLY